MTTTHIKLVEFSKESSVHADVIPGSFVAGISQTAVFHVILCVNKSLYGHS